MLPAGTVATVRQPDDPADGLRPAGRAGPPPEAQAEAGASPAASASAPAVHPIR